MSFDTRLTKILLVLVALTSSFLASCSYLGMVIRQHQLAQMQTTAQESATEVFGFNETHESILYSAGVLHKIAEILETK